MKIDIDGFLVCFPIYLSTGESGSIGDVELLSDPDGNNGLPVFTDDDLGQRFIDSGWPAKGEFGTDFNRDTGLVRIADPLAFAGLLCLLQRRERVSYVIFDSVQTKGHQCSIDQVIDSIGTQIFPADPTGE